MKTKICSSCKEPKPIDAFNFKIKAKNIRRGICKTCSRAYGKKHYANNRKMYLKKAYLFTKQKRKDNIDYIFAYLLEHPCIDCGEADPRKLEFDHINDDKKYNISDMAGTGFSFKKIQEEINKCEIRCANCHRLKTAKDYKWRIHELYEKYLKKKLDK